MGTSGLKWSAVSPLRLLKLFGIVVGSIYLVAGIALVGVSESPLVTATLWHMRNGNTVQLEGHSFRVPLLYEPELSKGGKKIDITESPRLFSRGASVSVEANAKVFDAEAAHAWQANLLAELDQHRNNTSRSVPLTLRGKKLTFVCINLGGGGGVLICHAVGTDLAVFTRASSPARIQQVRTILETSE
jgi:hypothetical protein